MLDMGMKRGEQNDAHEFILAFFSSITNQLDPKLVVLVHTYRLTKVYTDVLGGGKLLNLSSTSKLRLKVKNTIATYTPHTRSHTFIYSSLLLMYHSELQVMWTLCACTSNLIVFRSVSSESK